MGRKKKRDAARVSQGGGGGSYRPSHSGGDDLGAGTASNGLTRDNEELLCREVEDKGRFSENPPRFSGNSRKLLKTGPWPGNK